MVGLLGLEQSFLFLLSILSIPILLVTFYLQAFTLKKWCTLCLIISLILGSQFGLMLFTFSGWDFSLSYAISSAIIIFWVSFSWVRIKKLWTHKVQSQKMRQEYHSFKRNKKLFFNALNEVQSIDTNTLDTNFMLSFGDENAEIKLLTITNPLCGYCSEPFETYTKLIEYYQKNVQISVIFNVSTDEKNKAAQIALHIIALYQKNKSTAWRALLHWFKEKDLESWEKKYGQINQTIPLFSRQTIAAHRNWCKEKQINYTPKTIINNQSFPKGPYKISDLLFFMDDLIQNNKKTAEAYS